MSRHATGRRRRSLVLATGVLCAAVTTLPITAAWAAGTTSVEPSVAAADIAAGTQDPAKLAALQAINDVMEKDPDHFAGVVTDGLAKVTINLAGDATASRAGLSSTVRQAENLGIRTEVQHRKYSLRELTALKESIPNVEPFASLGDNLTGWGVNAENNSVRVSVGTVTPELTDTVRTTYGDKVTLEQRARMQPATGRFTNNPNYLGGDRIISNGWRCTGGFNIRNATGQTYALTSGHCFELGWQVVLEQSLHFFGTTQFRRYQDAVNIDMELIGVNVYRGGIFTGPAVGENLPQVPVHGENNSCQGCQVFFDGSVTGQALTTIETAGNSTDCEIYDDPHGNGQFTACHLVRVHANNGVACQGGDSGGPVFASDGQGGVTAVGIITSGDAAGTTCWYTRLKPILAYWQSTILTE